MTAHPRSRGENSRSRRGARGASGSSPLTRGKLPLPCPRSARSGLIPAHAGKTDRDAPRGRRLRAHPRSRGENQAAANARTDDTGSSPLTRGKHGRRARRPPRPGLIPAHAGKTVAVVEGDPLIEAHPRSRGENPKSNAAFGGAGGSSPLTRGKLRLLLVQARGAGLIPAHAGKTTLWTFTVSLTWAHPRSRGENDYFQVCDAVNAGSSPLTRGKPAAMDSHRVVSRIVV